VACGAVLRRMLLPMTSQAGTHVVVYRALRNRGFGQIPMTCRTGDSGLVMRCMAELDMSVRREAVDAYPGYLKVLVSVSDDFLYFRFFPRQLGMTEHAFSDRWNARIVAIIGSNMTINALHSKLHMGVVGERDGLLGAGGDRAENDDPYAACGMSNRSLGCPIDYAKSLTTIESRTNP
jgi:hypothetical protein